MQPTLDTDVDPQRPPKPTYTFHGKLPSAFDQLRNRRQWLTWDYVWNPNKRKWDKPPRSAHTGKPASINVPFGLGTFSEAAATARRHKLAGVGYVLKPDDNITGIDLDDCITDSGSYSVLAAEVLEHGETYAEVSPSGEGLRMLAIGKIEMAAKDDGIGVEMYGTGRYLTITGNQIEGTPNEIREAPRTIARLQQAVAEAKGRTTRNPKANGSAPIGGDYWSNVNAAALSHLDRWVPSLHPTARKQATGAWRIRSKDLGRQLEEDLAYHPEGINDWGEEHGLTPIDAVQRFGSAANAADAALWLCRQMGIEPTSLGWRGAQATGKPSAQPNGHATPVAAKSDEWPDPVPLPVGLLPVLPFDYKMLPEKVEGRVEDIVDRMQCAPELVAIPTMVALGTVIGRKVAVRPKEKDSWDEVGNIWGLDVAPPGWMKSPAYKEATSSLRALEASAREAFKAAMARFKADMKEGKVDEDDKPVQRRYIAQNVNAEAMAKLLTENPNGVVNMRDELMALLRLLDDAMQSEARGLYLSGWNGTSDYNVDRIMRGLDNYIPACTLSMFGCTQPAMISRYIHELRQGRRGNDGLIQRFSLATWPDMPTGWTNVDRLPKTLQREMSFKVFKKLDDMTPESVGATQEKIGDRPVGIPYLRFCPEAQKLFTEWHGKLEWRLRTGDWADDLLKEHISKYRGLVPKLALICHLADWDDTTGTAGPISVGAIQKALTWVEYLETHAARIYASGNVAVVEAAHAIVAKVKSRHLLKEGFSSRDVWRPQWSRLRDRDTVMAALRLLEDYDWATVTKNETGGREATIYILNPKVLT